LKRRDSKKNGRIFKKKIHLRLQKYSVARPAVDALGIDPRNPSPQDLEDHTKPSLTATEVNVLLQSESGQKNLRKWGYLKNERTLD